jgi:Helix-turn-helix domain
MTEAPTGKHRAADPAYEQASSGWVTTKVAAQALGVTQRTVRSYINRGELRARSEGEGRQKSYLVSIDSVHALRNRQAPPQNVRGGTPEEVVVSATPSAGDLTAMIRGLTTELVQASSEAAELRTRLQLTERAESTLHEQLQHERERAQRLEAERDRLLPDLLRAKDRADAKRERAEHFEAQLREALEARRGWLRRFFGF